jgi:hypothetical protein
VARRGALPLLVAALLGAVALSGCASGDGEHSTIAGLAGAPVVGGFVSQLKQEDDERETQFRREHEPQTPVERREAREQAEAASVASEEPAAASGGGSEEAERP